MMKQFPSIGLMVGVVATISSFANAAERVRLFNGKDLSGWTYHLDNPDVKMEEVWSVREGVLACKGQPVGYLLTEKNDFENYMLELEWRWPEKGGNNGALIHVTRPGALGVWPKCLEVQLADKEAGDFWIIGTTIEVEDADKRRQDRRHLNLSDGDEKPLGKWNKMEIVCRGDEVLGKVNGKVGNYATKLSQTKGANALQTEGEPVEYRNITLKKLKNRPSR